MGGARGDADERSDEALAVRGVVEAAPTKRSRCEKELVHVVAIEFFVKRRFLTSAVLNAVSGRLLNAACPRSSETRREAVSGCWWCGTRAPVFAPAKLNRARATAPAIDFAFLGSLCILVE